MLVLVFSYYKYKEVVMLEVLTDTAETVLKRRYYLKDEEGNCIDRANSYSDTVFEWWTF